RHVRWPDHPRRRHRADDRAGRLRGRGCGPHDEEPAWGGGERLHRRGDGSPVAARARPL
ncbi:MAG: hypothetical protein AVDCRST_MAG88-550, partial [uncultured Thermomicrobiales bacterium]